MTDTDTLASPMESVDKALLALEALSKAAEGLSLGALAATLGLKKNSLHRTLAALRYRGFDLPTSSSAGRG
jgi:DNA-binding IclR family transcriptional regulator